MVACAVWSHILTAVESAVHGEAAKRNKKLTFYANKSVDGLQLGEYLADFWKMGYNFDRHIMPLSKHVLLYFWGSFFRPFKLL